MAKIILAFAGEIASGKGAATEYLVKKYQASQHRYSTMFRDVLDRMYLEHNRSNIQTISTFFRNNFGQDIMSKVIARDVASDKSKIIVLDGARRSEDLKEVAKLPNFKLIYIDTDIKIRYQRIVSRGENSDDNSKGFGDFKKDNAQESETQIRKLKDIADFVVDNNGGLAKLQQQLDKIIKSLK